MLENHDSNTVVAIAIISALILEYVIGFYIQVKKIKSVKQEKPITWELEIYHSIVCIFHFWFCIFVEILELFVADTSESTKWLLCTFAWCVKTLGVNAIFSHSLTISMCKYIIIVHCKGKYFGRHNVVKLASFVMVAYQILWTLLGWFRARGVLIANYDFVSWSISMCDAFDWNHIDDKTSRRRFVCGFPVDNDQKGNWDFVLVGSEFFCIIQFIATFVVNLNVLEAFLYFKIFKSMHRYFNYASILKFGMFTYYFKHFCLVKLSFYQILHF